MLNEPEGVQFLTPEIEKDVARKKAENLCFYCCETLEGYSSKEVVRRVHRKCYRKIVESDKSMEFHVAAGLVGEAGSSGRKPVKDKATELAEKLLGASIAPILKDKLRKKKPKP